MSSETNRPRFNYTLRYALIGAAFGFTFPFIGTILQILFSGIALTPINMIDVHSSFPLLWVVDTAPIVLGMLAGYAGLKQDLLSKANEQLRTQEAELRINQADLEKYADERTAELVVANRKNERRTAQFEAIARISRAVTSVRVLSELLPQVARAISEQFGFYHVGIFLLDNSRTYAILAAANSEGGQRMLERNHRLMVGGTDVVAFVTQTGQPRLAFDTGTDKAHFSNPDLPDTHSELALPLRSGDVIGALDVQSTETSAFSEEDVDTLSILADQVSIAIQNARSYEQIREALAQANAASVQMSGQQWKQFLSAEPVEGYYFDGIETKKIGQTKERHAGSFSVPLTLRGIQIGTLKLRTSDPNRVWTEDEKDMARATAERTAIAVENARLLLESQKRAVKEQTIGQISAKLGSLNDLESLLRATIQELGSTLPDTDVAVQIFAEKPGRA
jgi:GAF domain-containing protein